MEVLGVCVHVLGSQHSTGATVCAKQRQQRCHTGFCICLQSLHEYTVAGATFSSSTCWFLSAGQAKVRLLHDVVKSAAKVIQRLRPLGQATLVFGEAVTFEGTKSRFYTCVTTHLIQP